MQCHGSSTEHAQVDLELGLAQERLIELTHENAGLAGLIVEKDNGIERFQSEINRLGEEIQLKDVNFNVRHTLQILCNAANLIEVISA